MDQRVNAPPGVGSAKSEVAQWEQLVTDGHVRAARFRWIQPWLIAVGVLLILAGAYLQYRQSLPASNGIRAIRFSAVVQGSRGVVATPEDG